MLLAVASLAAAMVAAVEGVHLAASRQGLRRPVESAGTGPEVVLVLGFPSRRDGRLHSMQRWRTDIAVRSMRGSDARLLFSGAGPVGGPSEAEVMARYAHTGHGVPLDRIDLETRARTTWENVAFSLGALERARTIRIASTPVHAARARRYLAAQRPDLAARLAPADDHRLGERMGWKAATVVHAAVRVLLTRRAASRSAPA